MKPGSRPGLKWCQWLYEITAWSDADLSVAYQRAEEAWCSRSTKAQYSALVEMEMIDGVRAGTLIHSHHCAADRHYTPTLAF